MEMEGADQSSKLLHVFSIRKYELEEQQLATLGASSRLPYGVSLDPNRIPNSNPSPGGPYTRPDSASNHDPGFYSTGHG
jgi:hypothetical protein